MKKFSAIYAGYRERQRLFAESALRQSKRRFVWVRGVLFWASFGLVMAILIEFQHRGESQPKFFNLTFLLSVLLLCGFFGYL
ncbi:MAG: hypothetical protein WCB58_13290 [Acidobacteriaceae bacterium]